MGEKTLKILKTNHEYDVMLPTESIISVNAEMSNARILTIDFWDGKSLKMLEMLFQRSDGLNHRVLWVSEKGEEMQPMIWHNYFKKGCGNGGNRDTVWEVYNGNEDWVGFFF